MFRWFILARIKWRTVILTKTYNNHRWTIFKSQGLYFGKVNFQRKLPDPEKWSRVIVAITYVWACLLSILYRYQRFYYFYLVKLRFSAGGIHKDLWLCEIARESWMNTSANLWMNSCLPSSHLTSCLFFSLAIFFSYIFLHLHSILCLFLLTVKLY